MTLTALQQLRHAQRTGDASQELRLRLRIGEVTREDVRLAAYLGSEEDRSALYRQVAERIHELAPMVFLNHGLEIAATRREVSGFRLHPTGVHRLERVSLSSD